MNANQFRVFEHCSYDMVATWCVTLDATLNGRIDYDASNRILNSLEFTITPSSCRAYLFPDYQFNASEYAKR